MIDDVRVRRLFFTFWHSKQRMPPKMKKKWYKKKCIDQNCDGKCPLFHKRSSPPHTTPNPTVKEMLRSLVSSLEVVKADLKEVKDDLRNLKKQQNDTDELLWDLFKLIHRGESRGPCIV